LISTTIHVGFSASALLCIRQSRPAFAFDKVDANDFVQAEQIVSTESSAFFMK
jgi:hypothetical protein